MPRRKAATLTRDLASENFEAGLRIVRAHPMLSALALHSTFIRQKGNRCPQDGWAVVTLNGAIHAHPTRRGEPEEWVYVLAHCLLHLGFGHFQDRDRQREWNAACDSFVGKFLADLKLGRPPEDMLAHIQPPAATEEKVYELYCARGMPQDQQVPGTAGPHAADMFWEPVKLDWQGHRFDWQECFGLSLARAASIAVNIAAGIETSFEEPSQHLQTLA